MHLFKNVIISLFSCNKKIYERISKNFFFAYSMWQLSNTYILHKIISKQRKNYAEYRKDIAKLLLKTNRMEILLKLRAQNYDHFPKYIYSILKQKISRAYKICIKKRNETII